MMFRQTNFKNDYHVRLEKAIIISLGGLILLFLLFPSIPVRVPEEKIVHLNIVVESIPITRQGVFRPPPLRPAVPIATEDETVPEDETIEETTLKFDVSPIPSAGATAGFGVLSYIQPRPIAEVFPIYPDEDYKKGISGIVKLHVKIDERGKVVDVIVLENTTNSHRCANAAKDAAFQTRYTPARQGEKTIACWVTRLITFEIPQ